MLFSKPIADLTSSDVEEFCRRFREGLRIEYKSTFDNNVKQKLPRTLSSFANSYGGILIIGVLAKDGVPQEPFEGIKFDDREPGLTVENICRDGVFPEMEFYHRLIPSRIPSKAFLIIEIPEARKAPHAIENSTQVYIRTGDSGKPTTLMELSLLERLLVRRREVSARWNEFFTGSWEIAKSTGVEQRYAYSEIRIGPLYPYRRLLEREQIYDFLSDSRNKDYSGFRLGEILRTPSGALAAREQNVERFLNICELGILHFIQPCYPANYQGQTPMVLDFWPMAIPVLKMIRLSGELIKHARVACELQVEAYLRNLSGQYFSSGTNPISSVEIKTVASCVPGTTQVSSQALPRAAFDTTAELMYQLRWPFGAQAAPSRSVVRNGLRDFLDGVGLSD